MRAKGARNLNWSKENNSAMHFLCSVYRIRGLPSMTSALEGGGGSGKVDKSTDKLRDHVFNKG